MAVGSTQALDVRETAVLNAACPACNPESIPELRRRSSEPATPSADRAR